MFLLYFWTYKCKQLYCWIFEWKPWLVLFFRIRWWIESSEEQHFFESGIFNRNSRMVLNKHRFWFPHRSALCLSGQIMSVSVRGISMRGRRALNHERRCDSGLAQARWVFRDYGERAVCFLRAITRASLTARLNTAGVYIRVWEREREDDIRQQPITNTFSNLRRTSDVKPGMKMSDIKRFSDNYISNHFSHKASMMNELYAVWDICLLELIEKGFSHWISQSLSNNKVTWYSLIFKDRN